MLRGHEQQHNASSRLRTARVSASFRILHEAIGAACRYLVRKTPATMPDQRPFHDHSIRYFRLWLDRDARAQLHAVTRKSTERFAIAICLHG